MANPKLDGRPDSTPSQAEEEAATLEQACREGEEAFVRARRVHGAKLTPGHYVVLNPTTLDYVIAPTQAEAIEQFSLQFPQARGSLHRVGEDIEAQERL